MYIKYFVAWKGSEVACGSEPINVCVMHLKDQPSPPPLPAHLQILKEERDRTRFFEKL